MNTPNTDPTSSMRQHAPLHTKPCPTLCSLSDLFQMCQVLYNLLLQYIPLGVACLLSAGMYLLSLTEGSGRKPPVRGITSMVTLCRTPPSSVSTPEATHILLTPTYFTHQAHHIFSNTIHTFHTFTPTLPSHFKILHQDE